MWDYTDKVKDYFFNPKNAGVLGEANAVGEVGAISCGDALKLMLRVEPETELITEAKFQTFGCGSAIASSSALTELIIGKTLTEAVKITNQDIADFLGGLPPEKMHCSVMGYEALQAAIANFRGEVWSDDHEEGALVCKCFGVDEGMIERAITMNKLTSVEQITDYTKAGGGCLTCFDKLEELLAATNESMVAEGILAEHEAYRMGTANAQEIKAKAKAAKAEAKGELKGEAPPTSPIAPASPLPPTGLTNLKKMQLIQEAIEELRPYLQKDGGDCELVDIDGSNVLVSLKGACMGCQMASVTVSGIQERLIAKLGVPVRVVPVKQHAH